MEEIKKDAERFAEFLDYADKYIFTKEALMNTDFFSCEEEMEVFFSQYDKKYYETKNQCWKILARLVRLCVWKNWHTRIE